MGKRKPTSVDLEYVHLGFGWSRAPAPKGHVERAYEFNGKYYVPHSVELSAWEDLESHIEAIQEAKEDFASEYPDKPYIECGTEPDYGGDSAYLRIQGYREATEDEVTYIKDSAKRKRAKKREEEQQKIEEAERILREKKPELFE